MTVVPLLAIDQASTSGYAIGFAHQSCFSLLHSGTAERAAERGAVLKLAESVRVSAPEAVPLIVCFEDHSDFYFGRGNASAASLLGMGAERGRWEEQFDMLEHPKRFRCKVSPKVWRKAVLGLPGNARADYSKAKAVEYAMAFDQTRSFTPDAAEALVIAVYAARVLVPGLLPKKRTKKVA